MEKKRVFQYDLMRVIFMLMVLGVHSLGSVKQFSHEFNTTWYFVTIATDLFMIGNPLFFMLSGKFNLGKDFSKPEDYKNFYIKRAISILVPFLEVSVLIYIVRNPMNWSVIEFLKQLLACHIESTYWFVYTLIGILLFSPFFAKMLRNMSDFEKKLFLAIDFSVNAFIVIFSTFYFSNAISFGVVGIAHWHLYYFAGYLLEDVFKTRKSRNTIIFLGICAFIIQFLIRRFMVSGYRLTDPSPLLTLEAFAMYFILLDKVKINSEKIQKVVVYLAKYSFVFYLLHIMAIILVTRLFDLTIDSIYNMFYGICIFVMSFVIAFIGSIIMSKIFINPIQNALEKRFLNQEK